MFLRVRKIKSRVYFCRHFCSFPRPLEDNLKEELTEEERENECNLLDANRNIQG